ncbi:unnamed protein product [Chironomus riparius]|uniref:Uncharacterized protein n=1 Tax=Chironomus riparius TaxID=315576 RepID=A0A9N9WN99_9DIPT|nr:unnamed protein product [Chironomus riparius]
MLRKEEKKTKSLAAAFFAGWQTLHVVYILREQSLEVVNFSLLTFIFVFMLAKQ